MTKLGGLVVSSALTVLAAVLAAMPAAAEPAHRIVSAGGSVTEIVYALGQESRLVARDSVSSSARRAKPSAAATTVERNTSSTDIAIRNP